MKIDLGCGPKGPNRLIDAVGVDMNPRNEPDIVADIRYDIKQLQPNCATHVRCSHVIEHLYQEDWRLVLDEIARLLMPGGTFEIRVPHPSHDDAMIHGHIHVMSPRFWHDIKAGVIKLRAPLHIDEIREIPNPPCEEWCRFNNKSFSEWAPFMRNAYRETVIDGWRK